METGRLLKLLNYFDIYIKETNTQDSALFLIGASQLIENVFLLE